MSVDWTSRQNGDTIKPRRKSIVTAILVVAIILGVGIVYALFQQTIPQVNVPARPLLTSSCSTLTVEGTPTAGSGVLLVDCGSGQPAFVIGNVPFQATPSFKIPVTPSNATTSLGIIPQGPTCVGVAVTPLVNNTALTFSTNQGYDYCLGYNTGNSAGTIGPVIINWAIP